MGKWENVMDYGDESIHLIVVLIVFNIFVIYGHYSLNIMLNLLRFLIARFSI